MQEYSSAKSDMKELYQIRKNYEKYMGKEMERQLYTFEASFQLVYINLRFSKASFPPSIISTIFL